MCLQIDNNVEQKYAFTEVHTDLSMSIKVYNWNWSCSYVLHYTSGEPGRRNQTHTMKNTDNSNTEEQNASRDVDASLHPIQKYVMGDMKYLDEWLDERPVVVQFPNWFLRGIGAPIFLNNPISGK